MLILLAGGVFIFPLTTLALRLAGRPTALPSGHTMAALATQIAFTVPIGLVVALGAAAHRTDWFLPGRHAHRGRSLPSVRVPVRDAPLCDSG